MRGRTATNRQPRIRGADHIMCNGLRVGDSMKMGLVKRIVRPLDKHITATPTTVRNRWRPSIRLAMCAQLRA